MTRKRNYFSHGVRGEGEEGGRSGKLTSVFISSAGGASLEGATRWGRGPSVYLESLSLRLVSVVYWFAERRDQPNGSGVRATLGAPLKVGPDFGGGTRMGTSPTVFSDPPEFLLTSSLISKSLFSTNFEHQLSVGPHAQH